MANIKFVGYWAKKWQEQYKVPKGYLIIKPKDIYKKNIGNILNKLHEFQDKKKEMRELDISIEYHYKKRTIDQNNLLWALYEIEANEMNAGMSGDKSQVITSMELYNGDLQSYAPRIEIKAKSDEVDFIKSEYKIEKITPINDEQGQLKYYIITALVSTSHFTTMQMAKWIDRIFNRMAVNGLTCTNPKDIFDYWQKWKSSLNDEKIILHDDIITDEEYRALNPVCEACGTFIGDKQGQLAHIKSKGSGGINKMSNYLHLCNECHIEIQHKLGYNHFLKLFPHLSYKITTALRRDYND